MKSKTDVTGIALIIVSVLLLIFLCVPMIIGAPGFAVMNFFIGVFGFAVYPYVFMSLSIGIMLFLGRKPTLPKFKAFSALGMYLCGMLILHLITSSRFINSESTFESYLSDCFFSASTMGGSLFGLLTYPVAFVSGKVFSYILYAFLFTVCALGWTNFSVLKLKKQETARQPIVSVRREEPLSVFSKDNSRVASQVRPINRTLFVSTITDNGVNTGHASSLKKNVKVDQKQHAKETLLQSFTDTYAKNEPVTIVNSAAAQSNEQELVARGVATTMPRPLVHNEGSEKQGRNEYGFNPSKALQEHLGGYHPSGRGMNAESTRIMPSKVSSSPDIRRATNPPNKIIYNDENTDLLAKEKSVSQAEIPQDKPPRRLNIVDGEMESQEIKDFQRAIERGEPKVVEKLEPIEQPQTKRFEEKLVVGDIESEIIKAERLRPTPIVQAAFDAIPLKPKPIQPIAEKKNKVESAKQQRADVLEPRVEKKQKFVFDTNEVAIDFSKLKDKSKNKIIDGSTDSYIEEVFQKDSEEPIFDAAGSISFDAESDVVELDDVFAKAAFTDFDKKLKPLIQLEESEQEEEGMNYVPPTVKNIKNASKIDLKNQIGLDDYLDIEEAVDDTPAPAPVKKRRNIKYTPPIIDLLDNSSTFTGTIDESCHERARVLEETLQHFNTTATVVGITKGPAVTRFELQMEKGTSVKRVHERADDIAYALAAKSAIRIEAPIPGMTAVGVEVPNDKTDIVGLKEIIDTADFKEEHEPLTFALGKDVAGKVKVCGLSSMPHLLIAGSTNSGKSSCLNVLITSLIFKYSPDDLKFLLIDPKRVEFISYEGLPHMLLEKAITEPESAISGLNWIYHESERRYKLFAHARVRDIKDYNRKYGNVEEYEKLPYIVIIIDEVADLMLDLSTRKQIEDKVKYLAQKARAAGIHLVLATQRPSVDVLTGTIKANLPSRIAFSVTNFVDSKTILDSGGAEKLLGKGDMLFASNNREPVRIQGAFISSQEVESVVNYVKMHNECDFDESIKSSIYAVNEVPEAVKDLDDSDDPDKPDTFMLKVLKYFIESQRASISSVQRKFSIGFNRAANIVDNLEEQGFIGPSDGISKQRQIYLTIDEFLERFGDVELD